MRAPADMKACPRCQTPVGPARAGGRGGLSRVPGPRGSREAKAASLWGPPDLPGRGRRPALRAPPQGDSDPSARAPASRAPLPFAIAEPLAFPAPTAARSTQGTQRALSNGRLATAPLPPSRGRGHVTGAGRGARLRGDGPVTALGPGSRRRGGPARRPQPLRRPEPSLPGAPRGCSGESSCGNRGGPPCLWEGAWPNVRPPPRAHPTGPRCCLQPSRDASTPGLLAGCRRRRQAIPPRGRAVFTWAAHLCPASHSPGG